MVELEKPEPAPGEVLLEVHWVGICSTDRRLAARGVAVARVPGHEIGAALPDGRFVGVHPDIGCGFCPACRAGFENRCPERVSVGLDRDGGLAEWLALPVERAVPVADLPPELIPLLEPLACCVHAIRLLRVEAGECALVVGAGAMGILATWALQAAGARVAVCQRSQPRRQLASELGADAVVSPEDHPEHGLGERPAVAIVTAPGEQGLRWALERTATGGRVHVFAGAAEGAQVNANIVHYKHLSLVGSTGSTLTDYRRALALASTRRVDLGRLPRTVVPLEAAQHALLDRGEPGTLKTLVEVRGGEG